MFNLVQEFIYFSLDVRFQLMSNGFQKYFLHILHYLKFLNTLKHVMCHVLLKRLLKKDSATITFQIGLLSVKIKPEMVRLFESLSVKLEDVRFQSGYLPVRVASFETPPLLTP